MPADPARDLQYLLDRQAILDCVYRYSRGLDRHDVDILSDAYHPDAVDHHGRFVGYIPEFVQWGNALHDADFLAHTHNITTHNCEIDGDEAHTESYVIFVLRRKDERTVLVGGGRYRPVDVPSGVHAVSGHAAMPHPGGGATPGSRSARDRDRPGSRCQHTMKGLAR